VSTKIKPSWASLCVLLARGDHVAGMLLERVASWASHGKATIKGVAGTWVANDREWWRREACLSLKQYNSAAARLIEFGLIEKRQHPFAGRSIVHMRPSKLTADILASAKTWSAAAEIFAEAKIPAPTLADYGDIKMPLSVLKEAWGGEVTPQDVGALAVFREEMKGFEYQWTTYNLTMDAPKLLTWAKANWIEISTKEAPKPSLAAFCDGLFAAALQVTGRGSRSPRTKVQVSALPLGPSRDSPRIPFWEPPVFPFGHSG